MKPTKESVLAAYKVVVRGARSLDVRDGIEVTMEIMAGIIGGFFASTGGNKQQVDEMVRLCYEFGENLYNQYKEKSNERKNG